MDTLGQIILYALLGVVLFLVAGFIGFRIPAPLRWPNGEPLSEVQHQPVPAGLPKAARRWLSDDNGGIFSPDTLVAWGRGKVASRLPIIGRVWLPLSWTMYLNPGSSFIIQNRITWFGRRFIRGGEEFREGKGTFILGSNTMDAPYLDETERCLGWLYSLWLAPGSLVNQKGVKIDENEDGSIRFSTGGVDDLELSFNLNFNPETGLLDTIHTVRKGSRSGDDYPYLAIFSQPRPIIGNMLIPTKFTGDWDNDVYVKLELVGMQYNQDISEAMQAGIENLPA